MLALMSEKGIGQLSYDDGIELPEPGPIAIDDILHWSGKERQFPPVA